MKRALRGAPFVLVLYVLAALLLPLFHAVTEALEEDHCPACESAAHVASAGDFHVPCTPDAPCDDPHHQHHNHPVHDASSCPVCSSFGAIVLDSPGTQTPLPAGNEAAGRLTDRQEQLAERATRGIQRARAPPLSLT